MDHVRGAPFHPQTQGKIERWHQTMKNRVLLENYYLPGDLERADQGIRRLLQQPTIPREPEQRHTCRRLLRKGQSHTQGKGETSRKLTIRQRRLQHQKQAA